MKKNGTYFVLEKISEYFFIGKYFFKRENTMFFFSCSQWHVCAFFYCFCFTSKNNLSMKLLFMMFQDIENQTHTSIRCTDLSCKQILSKGCIPKNYTYIYKFELECSSSWIMPTKYQTYTPNCYTRTCCNHILSEE